MTRRFMSFALAILLAACGPVDVSTAPATTPGATATASAPVEVGAQLRVRIEGGSGCEGGYACTARLVVLPEGTNVRPGALPEHSETDAIWQSDAGPGVHLIAPPDGDLPILAPGDHLIVWRVTARRIVTDPPSATAELASSCSTRVVVGPGMAVATVRIRFAGGSTLAPGSAECTMDQAVEAPSTATPSPPGIRGTALRATATLPTAWRSVATPHLDGIADPGHRVTLAVAPDGAFIAIPTGGEREALPILRSLDGETWMNVGSLPSSKGGWSSEAAWNDQVIIVTGGSTDKSRPVMWVSADGLDWNALEPPETGGLHLVDALAANSAGFVATQAGVSGVAPWIGGSDGGPWKRVGSLVGTDGSWIVDITASKNGFVAVGGGDATAGAWHSADALAWTPATIADGAGVTLVSVATDGQRIVAFGQGAVYPREDPLLFVSDDAGRSWARIPGVTLPQSSWPPLQAVADGFIATDSGVVTSHDGVTWDDTAWADSVGTPIAIGGPSVAASGARIVAAAMPEDGGPPLFWVGDTRRP